MEGMPASSRNLFRAALVLFVITVVIGILNGIDVWDPPRGTLITHVHAGTLGWITLAVFGAAIWMVGHRGSDTRVLATYAIAAISTYVLAFWSVDLTGTTTIQRPVGGTLAFIAIGWMIVWFLRAKRDTTWTIPDFGMALALTFLGIGAVLGVLLGLQLAGVDVVAAENTANLIDAHPAAMVIGFVILASIAIAEWMLGGRHVANLSDDRLGASQMVLVFLAGLFGMLGLLLGIDPLIQLNVPLEVIGIGIVLWRLRRHLTPSAWRAGPGRFVRTGVLGLIPTVILTAAVVQQFVSGAEFTEFQHLVVALDHTTFLLVVTNLILAMMVAGSKISEAVESVMYYGLLIGAGGFIAGLLTQSAVAKRIFTPLLGLILLHAILTLLSADESEQIEATV